MSVLLNCRCLDELPKLSWIASFNTDNLTLEVIHGRSVEIQNQWIVEGVWDDEFAGGNFHRSAYFFGSGIRIDNEKIYFVPSSAVVDRIFYCINGSQIVVSNSLINLLAYTGAKLDENHDYWEEATSIFRGEKDYQKEYRIIHPDIKCFHQVFYENIVFSGGALSFESRCEPLEKIGSYEEYYEKLTDILKKIGQNCESPSRQYRIDLFTTLSSGYDSTAVSALVKDIGVKTCFMSKTSNSWLPPFFENKSGDDGTPAARVLGLDVFYIDGCKSHIPTEDELFFWATTYAKHANQLHIREFFYHNMFSHIEGHCQAAVIFTGVLGDKVWNINTSDKYLNEHIIRDTIDQNSSEIRLKSGVFNLPVPFMMIRNIKDIVGIGRSEAMAPWRLNNHYDRPIARRIAETAGVKRGTFAHQKKGAATSMSHRYPYNKKLRKQFFQYLKQRHGIGPGFVYLNHYLNQFQLLTQKALNVFGLWSGGYKQTVFWKDIDLTFYLWQWATNELKGKTVKILETHKIKAER